MNTMKTLRTLWRHWAILYGLKFIINYVPLLRWVAENSVGLSGQDRQFDLLYAVLTRPEECIHHAKASQFIATLRFATFSASYVPFNYPSVFTLGWAGWRESGEIWHQSFQVFITLPALTFFSFLLPISLRLHSFNSFCFLSFRVCFPPLFWINLWQ